MTWCEIHGIDKDLCDCPQEQPKEREILVLTRLKRYHEKKIETIDRLIREELLKKKLRL